MAITQYHPEVQDRLFSFLEEQYEQSSKRWAIWVNPYMLQGFKAEPLPPGQSIGVDSISVVYDGKVWLERISADKQRIHHDLSKWAVHPHFRSRKSAVDMAMHWLNHNRQDLVRACIRETQEAISYRKKITAQGTS